MGFITKSLTKKRVAPMSAPLNGALAGTPWTTTGAIPVGALMRSAAFSLAIEGLETTSAAYKSVLQTSVIRHSPAGITGGPQLALFRHLWAHSVLAAAPDAIVFGGQTHWQDDWWNEKIPEPVEG
jgi:hypothetical protein